MSEAFLESHSMSVFHSSSSVLCAGASCVEGSWSWITGDAGAVDDSACVALRMRSGSSSCHRALSMPGVPQSRVPWLPSPKCTEFRASSAFCRELPDADAVLFAVFFCRHWSIAFRSAGVTDGVDLAR